MRLSLLLIAAAVQQTLAAALVVTQPEIPKQLEKRAAWRSSCDIPIGFKPGTTILFATCSKAGGGGGHYTELELNNCFRNENGQILVSTELLDPYGRANRMNSMAVLASPSPVEIAGLRAGCRCSCHAIAKILLEISSLPQSTHVSCLFKLLALAMKTSSVLISFCS